VPGGRTAIRWNSNDLPGFAAGTVLPSRWYKETLEPTSPLAKVVAQFEDGSAAAVVSSYGRGRTLMLGSYVSASAQSTPTPEAERFFHSLLRWAGVQLPVTVAGSPVEVRYTESGRDTLLFVFNHSRTPVRGEVSLARPAGAYGATNLFDGAAAVMKQDAQRIIIPIDLPAAGVQVLKISPK
jgi:hypothetical protein